MTVSIVQAGESDAERDQCGNGREANGPCLHHPHRRKGRRGRPLHEYSPVENRDRRHRPQDFTGIFIDMFNEKVSNYLNLYQPLGVSIKPAGSTRLVELLTEEIHDIFDKIPPAESVMPLGNVMGFEPPSDAVESFTFQPGSH